MNVHERRTSAQSSSVLIVDDDPLSRLLLEREVQELGFETSLAEDAHQAQEQMQRRCHALVITDIRMPSMSGVELTRWIKQHAPDTEVIVVTGYATVETAAEAVRLGAIDYLVKPFHDLELVASSILRAIEAHKTATLARQRIRALEAQHEWFADLLDRLPFAVVLVDRRAKAVMVNRAAQELFEQRDGLYLNEQGIVVGDRAADTSAIRALIRGAASPAESPVGGIVAIRRPSGHANLAIAVAPLSQSSMIPAAESIVAAVYISDPERRAPTATDLLQRLYGLTATEAALAATLMQGHSLEQAAQSMSVSLHTVRTHVKRVFRKTGTSRQGELVSLLLSGPALLRLSPMESLSVPSVATARKG